MRALASEKYSGGRPALGRSEETHVLSAGVESLWRVGWRTMSQLQSRKSDVIILPFSDANSSNQAVKNILTFVCYCWPKANLVISWGFSSHIPITNKLPQV